MATPILIQQNPALDAARIDLALKALHQIEALVPMAQAQADAGGDYPDLMLGLLGRIKEMNDAAMALIGVSDPLDESELVEHRLHVLGRKEAANG